MDGNEGFVGLGGFEGEQSNETQEVTEPSQTNLPESSDESGGINPAWNPVLENIPQEFHNHLIPTFKEWDSNYQKGLEKARSEVQSKYSPYQQFVDNEVDPGHIAQALQLRDVLENNPEQVYELLSQQFGQSQMEEPDQGYSDDEYNPQDITNNPQFQELQQNFQALTEAMEQRANEEREQELYNQELQNIETTIEELGPQFKERFGFDMDGEQVLRIALQNYEMDDNADGLDIPAAAVQFGELISRYQAPQPSPGQQTPNILPTSGGIPQANLDMAKLSEDQRQDMVAKMLANAAQQKVKGIPMTQTMQTVSAILKEVYQPGINEQLNNDVQALKRIKRTSKGVDKVGGRDAYFAIHTSRNEGIGARNEMEELPEAGQQGYNRGHVGLKYQYGGIQISGQSFELAKTDYQAFANVVDEEIKRLKEDLAIDLNRQVYGDGSGKLAAVASATGNTITLDNAHINNVRKGMTVDVFAAGGTGTAKAAARTITAIDYDARTITISGAAPTLAAGDIVVRKGNVNREWTGYDKIVKASGALHDIDPAAEPLWRSTVDSTGGEISEIRMIEMAHKIRAQGGKTTVILTSLGLYRKYWQTLQGMRQIVNTQEFKGGYSGLGFTTENGDIPFVADFTAPAGQMLYLNEDEIRVLQTHDWKFMDRDGGGMWQQVPGYDAYKAMLFQYSELATFRRNTHGKFTGLTES